MGECLIVDGPIQRMKTVRFDSGILSASFHPRNRCVLFLPPLPFLLLTPKVNKYVLFSNSKIILALLSTGELFITDLRREYRGRVELCDMLFNVRERSEREREEGEEGSVPPSSMSAKR